MIYFKDSVGIGENPQHLDEMDELGKIAEANDKLENLQREFPLDDYR
tara:strand:+ start:239 stop:379 length:141 start_codon:yes stop_codon:yes gene_type:complete